MRRLLAAASLVASLALVRDSRATTVPDDGPARAAAFLDRVFAHLPRTVDDEFTYLAWSHADQPVDEGVGLLRAETPFDPEQVVAHIMDVDRYRGHLPHLEVCRAIPDPRFQPPRSVRFRMLVSVEPVGKIQHELAQVDLGTRGGYRVVAWYDLAAETRALDPEVGARSAYSVGAWLVSRDTLGYAVSNAPVREDVNLAQWALLTTGAEVMAGTVARSIMDGMAGWR